jgi:hypothetical protein
MSTRPRAGYDAGMPLTLRPTRLAPPVYKDIPDYEVFEDGRSIDRRAIAPGVGMDRI